MTRYSHGAVYRNGRATSGPRRHIEVLSMDRGEVWWARLAPPIGTRPVLLLSRSATYSRRRSVTVAPITTTIRGIPVEVPLGIEDGLPRTCVVNCDDLN